MRLAPVVIVVAACGGNNGPGNGEVGGHCYPNGTCNTTLVCSAGVCTAPVDAGIDAPPDGPATNLSTQALTTDLDLLFVIDNSASTSDKQTVFAANFPKFVQALDAFPTGRPNVHIGVVDSTADIGVQGFGPGCPSPDPNDNGLLQNTPRVTGCSPPTGRFISDIKNSTGGRTTNYSGTLDSAFSCIAQIGSTGCGFESTLLAMKRALDGTRPENAGFVRAGALLGVVILTDEDDCSASNPAIFQLPSGSVGPGDFRCQPLYAYACDQQISASAPGTYTGCAPATGSYLDDPISYYQFLTTIKPAGELAVAMLIGDPHLDASGKATIMTGPITTPFTQSLALEPSCNATINGNPTIGRPGIRLASLLSYFAPSHAREYSICQSDYSAAIADIGQMLVAAISPCMQDNIDTTDTDATNPGTQLRCTVTEGSATLPACTMATATTVAATSPIPCWWSTTVAVGCPATPTHVLVNIERGGAQATATTLVSCVLAP
jgi:hypothetical protein